MRYFIAYLIQGKAKAFHESLTRELTHRFHTVPLYERIPPHITIKPPFDTDEAGIEDVERILRAFASGERAAPLLVRRFGRFGFRTIYLDVVKSPGAVSFVRRALHALNTNIPRMPRYPLEGNKLHASIARFLTRRQYRRVWRYVQALEPEFSVRMDNIAILEKCAGVWSVHATIPLRISDEDSGHTMPIHTDTMSDSRLLVS